LLSDDIQAILWKEVSKKSVRKKKDGGRERNRQRGLARKQGKGNRQRGLTRKRGKETGKGI
jgi:hypothetical protein